MSWSNIQNASNTDVSGTTFTSFSASFGAAVTAGSVVSGSVMWENDFPGPSLTSVTDDKGNSYTINVDAFSDGPNGEGFSSFYATSFPNGLPTTITANFSGSTAFWTIIIKEDSPGAGFTISLDGHAGQVQTSTFNTTGANLYSSGSGTTAANGDLINGFIIHSGGAPVYTAGTSPNAFTIRVNIAGDCASEDFVQTTAAAIAATFGNSSGSSGSVSGGVMMLAFKAVASDTLMAQIWV